MTAGRDKTEMAVSKVPWLRMVLGCGRRGKAHPMHRGPQLEYSHPLLEFRSHGLGRRMSENPSMAPWFSAFVNRMVYFTLCCEHLVKETVEVENHLRMPHAS